MRGLRHYQLPQVLRMTEHQTGGNAPLPLRSEVASFQEALQTSSGRATASTSGKLRPQDLLCPLQLPIGPPKQTGS